MSTSSLPQATIITLEYEKNHLEFSVVLHQPDWIQLVDLLEDPQGYLQGMGGNGGRAGSKRRCLGFFSPPA